MHRVQKIQPPKVRVCAIHSVDILLRNAYLLFLSTKASTDLAAFMKSAGIPKEGIGLSIVQGQHAKVVHTPTQGVQEEEKRKQWLK